MKRYYKFRATHPRYCENLIPSNEKEALLSGILRTLPIRNNDGGRLLLLEGGKKWKPKECSPDKMLRAVILTLHLLIAEPKTQVKFKYNLLYFELVTRCG